MNSPLKVATEKNNLTNTIIYRISFSIVSRISQNQIGEHEATACAVFQGPATID